MCKRVLFKDSVYHYIHVTVMRHAISPRGSPSSASSRFIVVYIQEMSSRLLNTRSDFFAGHGERAACWKSLIRTDPRRAVRALSLTGYSAESVEGDTALDTPLILDAFENVSQNVQGKVWRHLVNAGLIGAS
ncbi:hypothetical protein BC628DRAFT_1377001 [Trametes gibbosa]|nr:hypothetical protein BC628DRAFT_1377001 [Trametes gibbosa]